MNINWFTIFAQIFNFLLLLFILKVLLYKPIFRFMKERRESINNKIKDAEDKIKDGEKKQEEYNQKIELFEKEKKKRTEKFLSDLNKQKESTLEKMKMEISQEREKVKKQLSANNKKIIEDVNRILSQKFIQFAEKIFGSLADKELEEKMVNLFIDKLKTLTKKTIFEFNRAVAKNDGIINVATAFDLSKKNAKVLKNAVGKVKIKFKKMKFDTNPDLIIGVEMKAGNSYVVWNAKDILGDLETDLE